MSQDAWLFDLVEHDGTPIMELLSASKRSVTLGRNIPARADFTVKAGSELDAGIADLTAVGVVDLRVSYAGTPLFWGPISGMSASFEGSSTDINYVASGIASLWQEHYVRAPREILATTARSIIETLIQEAESSPRAGFTFGAALGSTGPVLDMSWTTDTPLLQAITSIAEQGLLAWVVRPTGSPLAVSIYLSPIDGDVVSPAPGEFVAGENVVKISATEDASPGRAPNYVTAVGEDGVSVTDEDIVKQTTYRRRELVVSASGDDAVDATALGNLAAANISDPDRAATLVTRNELITPDEDAFQVGNQARVFAKVGWFTLDGIGVIDQVKWVLSDDAPTWHGEFSVTAIS